MSMSLLPSTLYTSEPSSYNSLFRMLDEFNNYKREGNISHFHPKFDIVEHENEYELHGELPGLDKKDLHVEFTDAQTILMRGRIQRSYAAGTPPKGFEDVQATRGASKVVGRDGADGNKSDSGKAAGTKYWVAERSIGEFQRTFVFGHRVDQEHVTAELRDGMLDMHVPKADSSKGRMIEIK